MENKRTCAIVQDLLPSYVDKLTKPETTAFVDAHLTDCAECRRIYRDMAGTLPAEAVEAENVVRRLKMKHYRRVAIGWSVVVAVLLVAAICLLPLPRSINATHEGVIWRSGAPEDTQHTSVTVTGTYWDFLFRQDYFAGNIWVETLPQTHGDLSVINMGDGQCGIWYENEESLMKSVGSMFVRKDGSMLMLIHEEGHWDADTGQMLAAPSTTREEAVKLANQLAQELSPNWLGTWQFD